jgi:CheY-like chemotaxis protein
MAVLGDPFAAKILIVDDQPSNVRLLEFTLRRAGYLQVMSTLEPRDVAALHTENLFDLMVLDLQMPQLDGFGVMEQLKGMSDTAPVTILVMSADSTSKRAALAAGAAAFLGKPFKLPDFLAQVKAMLG